MIEKEEFRNMSLEEKKEAISKMIDHKYEEDKVDDMIRELDNKLSDVMARLEIVDKMIDNNYSKEEICKITNISLDKINDRIKVGNN